MGRLPSHYPVRDDSLRDSFVAQLLRGLAECERLGLSEHVGHQQVVVIAKRVE